MFTLLLRDGSARTSNLVRLFMLRYQGITRTSIYLRSMCILRPVRSLVGDWFIDFHPWRLVAALSRIFIRLIKTWMGEGTGRAVSGGAGVLRGAFLYMKWSCARASSPLS